MNADQFGSENNSEFGWLLGFALGSLAVALLARGLEAITSSVSEPTADGLITPEFAVMPPLVEGTLSPEEPPPAEEPQGPIVSLVRDEPGFVAVTESHDIAHPRPAPLPAAPVSSAPAVPTPGIDAQGRILRSSADDDRAPAQQPLSVEDYRDMMQRFIDRQWRDREAAIVDAANRAARAKEQADE